MTITARSLFLSFAVLGACRPILAWPHSGTMSMNNVCRTLGVCAAGTHHAAAVRAAHSLTGPLTSACGAPHQVCRMRIAEILRQVQAPDLPLPDVPALPDQHMIPWAPVLCACGPANAHPCVHIMLCGLLPGHNSRLACATLRAHDLLSLAWWQARMRPLLTPFNCVPPTLFHH